MATFKCHGLIIKKNNIGESDRILTIFTDKFGKVRAKAKGVRKTLSRLAGHLDLFCLTNLVLAEGKTLDVIIEAQTIECFPILGQDLKKTAAVFYLAELVDKTIGEHEPNLKIFHLLLKVLQKILLKNDEIYLRYFEINLLKYLGFRPHFGRCMHCQEKLKPTRNFFSPKEGGVLDIDCRQEDPTAIEISVSAIKLLRLMLQEDLDKFSKIKASMEVKKEMKRILSLFLNYTLEKKLSSAGFLEKIK